MKKVLTSPSSMGQCGSEPFDLLRENGYEIINNPYGRKLTEDEVIGWHHQLNGHEVGQTLGDGEGHRGLVCCSPSGLKESDTTTEQQITNLQISSCLGNWI